MNGQTFIVRLDPTLSRRVRAFLAERARDYSSLDELIGVALENQLGIEGGSEPSSLLTAIPGAESPVRPKIRELPEEHGHFSALLERPHANPPLPLAEEGPRGGTLSAFTNRLSPVKIAARVLANMSFADSAWPSIASFREVSAEAARELGLRLRKADGNAPTVRRWVAYPVGEDPEKAKARFANSFALASEGPPAGPLVLLGLVNVLDDHRVALTRAGWRLAVAPSPLADGSDGITLSPAEAEILRAQLMQSPDEIASVREFIRLVRESRGRQKQLDELLAEDHARWSKEVLIAHRSAMLGRLSDLRVVEVAGRGLSATIQLLSAAGNVEAGGSR